MRDGQPGGLSACVALNATGNLMLRLVGINRARDPRTITTRPRSSRSIVDESEEGGQLRAEAGQMLRELFAFSDTRGARGDGAARPRHRHRIGSAPEDVRRTRSCPPNALPRVRGDPDHIVGYIHIKDLLRARRGGAAGHRPKPAPDARTNRKPAALDDVLARLRRA